jgi:hypothetical protein
MRNLVRMSGAIVALMVPNSEAIAIKVARASAAVAERSLFTREECHS